MRPFRRLGLIGAAASLSFGLIYIAAGSNVAQATPLAQGPGSSCTYTDAATGPAGTGTAAIVVNPGDSISISCTGLPTSLTSAVVAESTPLAGALPSGSTLAQTESLVDISAADLGCPAASGGSFSCTYTLPTTYAASSGNPDAVCPPTQAEINAGLTNCVVAVADAAGDQFNAVQLVYASQVTTTPAAPSLSLSSGNGVAGDVETVTGSGWWGEGTMGAPNTTVPVSPLATVGGTVATSSLTIAPALYTLNASNTAGVLTPPAISGTITIPSGLSAGAQPVLVDEPNTSTYTGNGVLPSLLGSGGPANVEGASSFAIEGAPTIQVAPSKGGVGTGVSVTGSGFDPQGSAIGITGLAVGGSGTVNAAGDITGSITVTAGDTPGDVTITATQTAANAATLTAGAPFTVTAQNAGPSATDGTSPVTLNQVVAEQVTGVPVGLIASENTTGAANPDSTDVTMSGTTLNGVTQIAHGTLNTVTVVDERGTLVGWSATSILETDFLGPGTIGTNTWDHAIPGSDLSWTPNLTIPVTNGVPDGVASEITLGSPTSAGQFPVTTQSTGLNGAAGPYNGLTEPTTPINLCTAPAGGGGGTFECGGSLSLVIPAFVAQGHYQATLDIIVI